MTLEQFIEARRLVGMVGDDNAVVTEHKDSREVEVLLEFNDKNGDGELIQTRLETYFIERDGRRFFSDRVVLEPAA
jgi:hypothetical protein